jgi:hypothetical protein
LGEKKEKKNGEERRARKQRKPKNAKNKMVLNLEFWPFYKSLILGLEAISTSKTFPTIFSPQIEALDFQNFVFIYFSQIKVLTPILLGVVVSKFR